MTTENQTENHTEHHSGNRLETALDPAVGLLVRLLGRTAAGIALFAFIPLVLFLLVTPVDPVAASLPVALALMVGHRFLARPYMERVRGAKCLWCNRALPEEATAADLDLELELDRVELETRSGRLLEGRACRGHGAPARRWFGFLERWRFVLLPGIFLPLLTLLAALLATALGASVPLALTKAGFQLAIGLTVNFAAVGFLLPTLGATVTTRPRVPFPVHNFFLLGVRPLVWIFRVVGVWWVVVGGLALVGWLGG